MFQHLNPLMQSFSCVMIVNGNGFLQYNGSRIHTLIDKMNSAACDFNTVGQGISHTLGARKAGSKLG